MQSIVYFKRYISFLRLGGGPQGGEEIKEHSFFASINWDDLYNKKVINCRATVAENMHILI